MVEVRDQIMTHGDSLFFTTIKNNAKNIVVRVRPYVKDQMRIEFDKYGAIKTLIKCTGCDLNINEKITNFNSQTNKIEVFYHGHAPYNTEVFVDYDLET